MLSVKYLNTYACPYNTDAESNTLGASEMKIIFLMLKSEGHSNERNLTIHLLMIQKPTGRPTVTESFLTGLALCSVS